MSFFLDLSANPLLLTGLLAGVLAGLACGVIGPYVVTRRIVFLGGAIAHVAVGGLGAAIYLRYHYPTIFDWLLPIHGAALVSVLAAALLAVLHLRVRERADTLIGALWAVGMAVGILLIKLTPGYQTELMGYLFGNLSFVSWHDVVLMTALDVVIVVTALIFHKRFLAICLDPEQAELQGVSLLGTELVMLILVALTVITLTQVVGLILVIALLSLPAVTAGHHLRRLAPMICASVVLAILLTTVPRIVVYGSQISPEPAIVLTAAAVFLVSLAVRRFRHGAARR